MTERTVQHATIVVERTYDASPARVFAAWSSVEALSRWASPGEGWDYATDHFDFRVGGGEVTRFGPKGGDVYTIDNRFEDIVENVRIVFSGSLTSNGKRQFACVTSAEMLPSGQGCRLVVTEQTAYLDGGDSPEDHEGGWTDMLKKLGDALEKEMA